MASDATSRTAAPQGQPPQPLHTLAAHAARRVPLLDWLMLVLALVSIGLLSYETWGPVTPAQRDWILRTDYLICALFAVEFTWRWSREGWDRKYPLHNWYEILGMIPLAEPALRGFRLFRVIRILILLGRFGMAADRAMGDEFTYRLVSRFQRGLVDAIKAPITVGVLEEVEDVLARGRYTQNIARALNDNEQNLEQMIVEKLKADPQTGRLARLPFYDDLVRAVTRAMFRVVLEVLRDPRTDELVGDMLRENLQQIRQTLREKERERGKAVPARRGGPPPPRADPPAGPA